MNPGSRLFRGAWAMLAGALVFPTAAHAATQYFVRSAVMWVQPTDDDFESQAGALAQLGMTFDSFDVMLETGWVEFTERYPLVGVPEGPTAYVHADFALNPILLTGSWRLPLDKAAKLSAVLGASVGVSRAKLVGETDFFGPGVRIEDSGWGRTFGVDAALEYHAGEHLDLVLGYKYLLVNGLELFGSSTDDLKSHVIYGGLGFRW